ncbi:hypothetical protein SAMN05444156_0342 [Verrucomicrobium sp. GAS474]|uniref:hypothetical protein n=1 Tax=Verrucomicrobium sp. GAS474 TaxID=1882831 RepID=UPI00087DCB8E|nr:hypothetical protein [Verrucomicrobium sp. GAS474]SDT87759.1 hypothetical protein SAMN05444156_0342 [Verrucomicrobium sp. GAS474]
MAPRTALSPARTLTLAGAVSLNGVWEPLSPRQRAALARLAGTKSEILFPTPDEAACHLAAGEADEVVLLWRARLAAGPGSPGFAAPFTPPGGRARLAFRLLSVDPAPAGCGPGVVARYGLKK